MCPLGERVRNGALLSLLGWGKLGPPHTHPKHMPPCSGPSHPPSPELRSSLRMQVGNPVPQRNRSPRCRGEERTPRLTPGVSGPRERRSTRPASPTRAWRQARPGELRGAEVPGERPRAPARCPPRVTRKAEPRGRSHKVTNPAQGERACLGPPGAVI